MQQYIGIQNITAHVMICAAVRAVLGHHIECILTPFLSGALPLSITQPPATPDPVGARFMEVAVCTLQTIRTPKPVVATPPLSWHHNLTDHPPLISSCSVRTYVISAFGRAATVNSRIPTVQIHYPPPIPCQADSLAGFDLST